MANPLATILSLGMLLRYSFGEGALADRIDRAVGSVLEQGLRTPDIHTEGQTLIGTEGMVTRSLLRCSRKSTH